MTNGCEPGLPLPLRSKAGLARRPVTFAPHKKRAGPPIQQCGSGGRSAPNDTITHELTPKAIADALGEPDLWGIWTSEFDTPLQPTTTGSGPTSERSNITQPRAAIQVHIPVSVTSRSHASTSRDCRNAHPPKFRELVGPRLWLNYNGQYLFGGYSRCPQNCRDL
jgi:hypothetical protein